MDEPIIVPEGKIIDFIDGKLRNDTPEEYVRQQIERSIVKEYLYPKTVCEVEFSVKMGSSKKRVDITIFGEGDEKNQESVKIIVECKKETISPNNKKDGVDQLKSYMAACINADLGFWTNGKDRFCFRKIKTDGGLSFDEINDIPKFNQTLDESEKFKVSDLREATGDNLKFTFRRCHDYIAGNQGLQKPEAFWELLKIIFCKIEDERSGKLDFYTTSEERKTLNGQIKVTKRIEDIFKKVVAKKKYKTIFKDGESIGLNQRVLAFIVSQLQSYSLLESNVDVKGAAYEEIVGANLRGDRGEFFTPRNICQMIVEMIDPILYEKILDPSCGTGGFLVIAMNHSIHKINKIETKNWRDSLNPTNNERMELFRKISEYSSDYIKGLDFNPNLVKATKMNMVMNNDGSGSIFQSNSLDHPHTWKNELRDNFEIKNSSIDKLDIIITNPPFGTKIPIDDPKILEQYDIAHIWEQNDDGELIKTDKLQKSVPPELLFIERNIQFLKEGGRMAIVLPDSILGSPGLHYIRNWILKHAKVVASLDLDKDTFQPKNGTQTSVLFLVKKTKTEINIEQSSGRMIKYPVFMAMVDKVGHDKRGNLTYKRDNEGNEIVEKHEEEIKEDFNGKIRIKKIETQSKISDDQTSNVAQLFSDWKKDKDIGF